VIRVLSLAALLAVGGCAAPSKPGIGSALERSVVEIARREATRQRLSTKGQVVSVTDDGEEWSVHFTNPPDLQGWTTLGGGIHVTVDKRSKRAQVYYVEQ
jgi:hypothetical protein